MNSCQMNNITNPGAPSSPTGTTSLAATTNTTTTTAAAAAAAVNDAINISNNTVSTTNSGADKKALDNTSSIPGRPKSPDGLSRSASPLPSTGQQYQQNPPTEPSLKVKIKTNNISISKSDLTDTDDSNNNTNNKSKSETDNKTSANNKSCSRKSKPNNGDSTLTDTNNSISIGAINSTIGDHHSSIGETTLATKLIGMNNHESSSAENGNQSSQTPSLSLPPPPPQPSQSTLAPQAQPVQLQPTQQAQQPIILQPQSQQPLAPPSSTTPQPVPAQQSPALTVTSKASGVVATTPPEPKPKATRTRKPPAASSKNATANTTSASSKPESKPRKSKAKQNAENKAAAAAAAATASTTSTTSSASLAPTLLSAQQTSNAAIASPSSASSDKKIADSQRQTAPSSASKKRKPRSTPTTETIAQPTNPPKRTRKKKVEQISGLNDSGNNNPSLLPTNVTLPLNVTNPQLLTVASSMPMGLSPSMNNMHSLPPQSMQPLNIHSNRPGMSPMEMYDANRLYMTMPYPNSDPMSASSLTRPSLSRLFTSSSSSSVEPGGPPHTTSSSHPDEIAKAFEELKDNVWNQVSRSVIELAQHFDIPSLIGTLYTLRQENEKLVGKVRDLTAKRDQLIATNARYDLPGPLLTQHLSHTSPNFSSVVASLANSPKSMANSSPSPAMNKSPLVPGSSYNHVPPGSSLGPPPGYGRNSPLIGIQTQHSGVSSLKSTIPLPSPPTGALLAHGANNRAGLMTVNNSPYMTNVHPSMNALNQLGGPNTPSSSYYTRQ